MKTIKKIENLMKENFGKDYFMVMEYFNIFIHNIFIKICLFVGFEMG